MRILPALAAICALSLAATSAQAQTRDPTPQPEPIARYPGARIAPDKAYLVYRAPLSMTNMLLLRMPPEVSASGGTIDYPRIDAAMRLNIAQTRLAFLRDRNLFLIEIQPGTYTIYGEIGPGEFGFSGRCMCMGTVSFEARIGQVTNLGEFRPEASAGVPGPAGLAIVPPSDPLMLRPPFADGVVVPADYHAAGKLPNLLGVEIDRLMPIPGVLAYDRDKVIDLAGTAAPAP